MDKKRVLQTLDVQDSDFVTNLFCGDKGNRTPDLVTASHTL
jgi:hypothetical protein